jgi:hypothetical protein
MSSGGRRVVYKDGTVGWSDAPALPPEAASAVTKDEMLQGARERRDVLLAEEVWYTSKQIVERTTDAQVRGNPDEYTNRLRSERRSLGVRFRGQYLHPASQFQPSGVVHPAMVEVLKFLPHSDANWAAAFWWFQPTGLLDGQRQPRTDDSGRPQDSMRQHVTRRVVSSVLRWRSHNRAREDTGTSHRLAWLLL